MKNGKCGYIDQTGEEVVPCKYDVELAGNDLLAGLVDVAPCTSISILKIPLHWREPLGKGACPRILEGDNNLSCLPMAMVTLGSMVIWLSLLSRKNSLNRWRSPPMSATSLVYTRDSMVAACSRVTGESGSNFPAPLPPTKPRDSAWIWLSLLSRKNSLNRWRSPPMSATGPRSRWTAPPPTA